MARPRTHAVAAMAAPVATSCSDELTGVGHDGAVRHRWSFYILMRTQRKHKEEERRPEAARPRRAHARQRLWRPWPPLPLPRLWGPHLHSNSVVASSRTWLGPWWCCWCGGLERGAAAAMRRRSAWCSQRSPALELGMGWTRKAERGTEGDGGRDGAGSALCSWVRWRARERARGHAALGSYRWSASDAAAYQFKFLKS